MKVMIITNKTLESGKIEGWVSKENFLKVGPIESKNNWRINQLNEETIGKKYKK